MRDAVLNLYLRLVDIGSQLKCDYQGHHAIGGGLREHVERVFDAVDGLLQGSGDGLGDRFRICAGVRGLHHDGGRHDLGIFADGQAPHGDEADDENESREHAREDRAPDEELGKVHDCVRIGFKRR